MSRSSKGSSFERAICRQLSLWWTDNTRDDIFWRTSMSGGRATVRAKSGKATFGAYGDITAVDPIGRPLTQFCTIELKRGYSKTSFGDSIDKPKGRATTAWEDFVTQAMREKEPAAKHWLLIVRRDRRSALVFMSLRMFNELRAAYPEAWEPRPCPCVMMTLPDFVHGTLDLKNRIEVIGMKLGTFLNRVEPTTIQRLANAKG